MKLITTCYKDGKKDVIVKQYEAQAEGGGENQVVNLYPDIEYQTIIGFGGAVTEASGYVFSKLGEENKKKVIDLYYGEDGNRYNMVRSHMDSCDFALDMYEAMSDPNDKNMESFTLERDDKYIIPLLKAAWDRALEPMDLMLSSWSPPAFMKTNGERKHGGKLKKEYYGIRAEYICRYIKEYEQRGYKVNRITVQNEPLATQTWDSCIFTAEEEKEFVRDHLYPALLENGLSHVKINIWDHNKEKLVERASMTIDSDTDKMIDGIAFHWYTGDHFEALTMTHELFPDKELIFTEGCVEYSRFSDDQLHNAQMYGHDIMGNLNGGMTGFIDWNLILDEKGGPNHVNNYCDAPIMVDTNKDEVEVKLSFDYIGHFSKYIHRGAKRIGSSKYTKDLEMTAFKNLDGSIAAVLMNTTEKELPVNIHIKGMAYKIQIPGNSIATALI
ncbi:MAG: glucosylceramidase [Clostridiales bacterium]|nr:glucosylceramidase [Clostridiales bacterium]